MYLLMISFFPSWVSASEFPDPPSIPTCAKASVEVWGWLYLGDAELGISRCSQADAILGNVAKRFSLVHQKPATASRLTDLANRLLKKNLDQQLFTRLQQDFSCIIGGYRDANVGDRYDTIYYPGMGTWIVLNNEVTAYCDHGQAGELFFSIWFGETAFNKRLKKSLLSNALSQEELRPVEVTTGVGS